jgi:hypothetical protein
MTQAVSELLAAFASRRSGRFWRAIVQAGVGCLTLGLLTLIGLQLHAGAVPVALFCLVLVLLMSLWAGPVPALLVAILSPFAMQPFFSPQGGLSAYWLRALVAVAAWQPSTPIRRATVREPRAAPRPRAMTPAPTLRVGPSSGALLAPAWRAARQRSFRLQDR